MIRFISIFCSLLMIFMPTLANAQEIGPSSVVPPTNLTLGKISQLRENQRAPFPGILLSDDVAAKLFGDIKFSERECNLRLDRRLKLNTLQLTSQLNALKLRFDVETTRTESLLSIKNIRIEFLEKNLTPPRWYESGEFWFAIGVVTGIAVTIGSAYALGQAAK